MGQVFAGDKDESGHVKHCFNYLRQVGHSHCVLRTRPIVR